MKLRTLLSYVLGVVCVAFLAPAFGQVTQTPEQAFIQGFAQWQANRIEKIILDEVVIDIAKDPYIKRFFSDTSENISIYNGVSSKRLIPLMQYYLEEDVKRFKGLVNACIPSNINIWFDTAIDVKIRTENAVLLYDSLKRLGEKPEDSSTPYTVSDFVSTVCVGQDLSSPVKFSFDKSRIVDVLEEISDHVKDNSETLVDSIDELVADLEVISDFKISGEFKDFVNEKYLKNLLSAISEYQKITDSTKNYTVRVHQMFLIVGKFGGIAENDYPGFRKLQDTSLFFASLLEASESKSPDAIVALLDSYVDAKGAYLDKRFDNAYYSEFDVQKLSQESNKMENVAYSSTCNHYYIFPCSKSIFFSSYYGLSFTHMVKNAGEERKFGNRLFGPVGIELKLLTYRSKSITLNVAPFDIGNYITNELKDSEYNAKFEDIVAPSIFFSYSFSSKPISLLLGYQKDIKVDENTKTEGPFFSIAFDLPIATIY